MDLDLNNGFSKVFKGTSFTTIFMANIRRCCDAGKCACALFVILTINPQIHLKVNSYA
jgi:hypothetical protein